MSQCSFTRRAVFCFILAFSAIANQSAQAGSSFGSVAASSEFRFSWPFSTDGGRKAFTAGVRLYSEDDVDYFIDVPGCTLRVTYAPLSEWRSMGAEHDKNPNKPYTQQTLRRGHMLAALDASTTLSIERHNREKRNIHFTGILSIIKPKDLLSTVPHLTRCSKALEGDSQLMYAVLIYSDAALAQRNSIGLEVFYSTFDDSPARKFLTQSVDLELSKNLFTPQEASDLKQLGRLSLAILNALSRK